MAIEALPAVVAAHPDVLYLVAGQTHPEVVKHEGERYRLGLERLVRDLGLTEHVHFVDRFLTVDELAVLLRPHRPLPHAVPVAGADRVRRADLRRGGRLPGGVHAVLLRRGPAVPPAPACWCRSATRRRWPRRCCACSTTRPRWPRPAAEARPGRGRADLAGRRRGRLLEVLARGGRARRRSAAREDGRAGASSPRIRPDHLLTMVDDVGIVQHADGVVPNRVSGYCVDDVARLVVVALGLDRDLGDPVYTPDADARRWPSCGTPGTRRGSGMRNFMAYDRRWLDEPHDGDHVGRAAWALGEVVAAQPAAAAGRAPACGCWPSWPRRWSGRAQPARAGLHRARAGPARRPAALPEPLPKLLRTLADRLAGCYAEHRQRRAGAGSRTS